MQRELEGTFCITTCTTSWLLS